jgi:nicotinamide-nucleotide adenylyltransferase
MRALFVGRFQPFHNGHLKAIQYIAKLDDFIIIGVGSSQEKNTTENPFSFEERRDMIERSIKLDKEKYVVKPIPDFGNSQVWVDYIRKNLPAFDVVYTSAPREKKIFKDANIRVSNVPLFDRTVYTGTAIRRKISAGERWGQLVPKGTAEVIKKADGVKRITRLFIG